MAKVAIKNENITPSRGIYHIMDVFSKLDFEGLTESVLGRRGCSGKAFSHGSIFCSLFSSYLCGGDCLEDINALVGQFWQRPDTLFPQLDFHRGHHRRGWEPWQKHQREVPSGGHAPAHHAPRNLGAWRGDSPFPCRLRLVLKGNRPNRRQAGWKPLSCILSACRQNGFEPGGRTFWTYIRTRRTTPRYSLNERPPFVAFMLPIGLGGRFHA